MKFLVVRTSQGAVAKKAPCQGAKRGPESTVWPGEHQWIVELDKLEDLVALLHKTGGGLGLFVPEEGEEHPTIEIYDEDE